MFKEEGSEELNEVKQIRHELNNPVVETEEKHLTEEESLDWLVSSINKRIEKEIRNYFAEDDSRNVEEYNLKVDNFDGEVVLGFEKEGEIVHTLTFKA